MKPPLNLVLDQEYTSEEITAMEIQRDADIKWFFEFLLAHKEYQRKWKGQLQILFSFSPDELEKLKEGK